MGGHPLGPGLTCPQCGSDVAEQMVQAKNSICSDCRADGDRYRRYGVTAEQMEEMREQASDLCLICKSSDTLVIDHCHETDKVRGLLCNHCNKGLGHFRDNPELLAKAIDYLHETS